MQVSWQPSNQYLSNFVKLMSVVCRLCWLSQLIFFVLLRKCFFRRPGHILYIVRCNSSYTIYRYLCGSLYVRYNSEHGVIHSVTLHCLQQYVDVFRPLPFLLLQTTHWRWHFCPLERLGNSIGKWRPGRRFTVTSAMAASGGRSESKAFAMSIWNSACFFLPPDTLYKT